MQRIWHVREVRKRNEGGLYKSWMGKSLWKLFKGRNYSRAASIQGNTVLRIKCVSDVCQECLLLMPHGPSSIVGSCKYTFSAEANVCIILSCLLILLCFTHVLQQVSALPSHSTYRAFPGILRLCHTDSAASLGVSPGLPVLVLLMPSLKQDFPYNVIAVILAYFCTIFITEWYFFDINLKLQVSLTEWIWFGEHMCCKTSVHKKLVTTTNLTVKMFQHILSLDNNKGVKRGESSCSSTYIIH